MPASHLDMWAVVEQIQVGGERARVWLHRKAVLPHGPQVHSSGVHSAPGPQKRTVAENAVHRLHKQRLQGSEEGSGGGKEVLHVGSLFLRLCP